MGGPPSHSQSLNMAGLTTTIALTMRDNPFPFAEKYGRPTALLIQGEGSLKYCIKIVESISWPETRHKQSAGDRSHRKQHHLISAAYTDDFSETKCLVYLFTFFS